jgi:hypothetical protein
MLFFYKRTNTFRHAKKTRLSEDFGLCTRQQTLGDDVAGWHLDELPTQYQDSEAPGNLRASLNHGIAQHFMVIGCGWMWDLPSGYD